MIREKKKILIVAAAMVAVMMIGTASAYFSDTDSATNEWTVGSVDIDLQEPTYDEFMEKETKELMPNETVHKDPMIENTGKSDAYVFLRVDMPKAEVKTQNENGSVGYKTVQELFEYEINDGWVLVDVYDKDTSQNTYVYAYGTEDSCTVLEPGAKTPALFKNTAKYNTPEAGAVGMITFKNIMDVDDLKGTNVSMPVEAFGIQTSDLTSEDVSSPEDVWGIFVNKHAPL